MKHIADVKTFFRNATIDTNPTQDQAVLADALGAAGLEPARRRVHALGRIGRVIMKSPITKAAVAVVVLLAAAGGVFLWTGTKSGVALAEVLAKMEQVQAFSWKMTMHAKGSVPGMAAGGMDAEMSMLAANEYGMRMDVSLNDPNRGRAMTQQTYWLIRQKMAITVLPEEKMYTRMELDESMFEAMRKENNDPRMMIRQILNGKCEELGKSVIDGVEVQGFRTTDPAYAGSGLGDSTVTVWADVKSGLPVRMDIKAKMNGQMAMEGMLHDFQWNVPVSEAEFTPVIPPDYTAGPGDGAKLPALTEETAIAGLKRCQELSGKYPDDLNFATLAQVTEEAFKSERTTPTLPEHPEPSDLTAALEKLKLSRPEMPPQRPGPEASREEREKWLGELKKWSEARKKSFEERKKWFKEAFPGLPERPEPPDLTAALEKIKTSRSEEPPEEPDPQASPEELKKWFEARKKWRDEAFAEEMKAMEELHRRANERTKEMERLDAELRKKREELKEALDGETQKMMPVQMLGVFYMTLGADKDPAYYGKVVKPGDAAQVLLRWKTGENQYRVIFGDLHAETVNADTLAKLEAAIPK